MKKQSLVSCSPSHPVPLDRLRNHCCMQCASGSLVCSTTGFTRMPHSKTLRACSVPGCGLQRRENLLVAGACRWEDCSDYAWNRTAACCGHISSGSRRSHGHNLGGCKCMNQVVGYSHTPTPSRSAPTRLLTTCPADASTKIGGYYVPVRLGRHARHWCTQTNPHKLEEAAGRPIQRAHRQRSVDSTSCCPARLGRQARRWCLHKCRHRLEEAAACSAAGAGRATGFRAAVSKPW